MGNQYYIKDAKIVILPHLKNRSIRVYLRGRCIRIKLSFISEKYDLLKLLY